MQFAHERGSVLLTCNRDDFLQKPARQRSEIETMETSAKMTIQIPEDVARGLASIAAGRNKTVEQLAVENLRLLLTLDRGAETSSPEILLRALQNLPHPSPEAVDDLEAAIRSGRLPVRDDGPFDEPHQR